YHFARPGDCVHCQHTGRQGEVTAFDLFRADPYAPDPVAQPSRLPLSAYLLGLAARGDVPLDDVLAVEQEQLRNTYRLLAASERARLETNAALERKVAELEAANQVLKQRTDALISVQGVSQ